MRSRLLPVALVLLAVGCGKPTPRVAMVQMPPSMNVNVESSVVIELRREGGRAAASDVGILDITFGGNPTVRVSSSSDIWNRPNVYPPGSEIWHRSDASHANPYAMKATYLLVSTEATGWDDTSTKRLALQITPRDRGTLRLLISGAFTDAQHSEERLERCPKISQYDNQQGYPCDLYEIPVY